MKYLPKIKTVYAMCLAAVITAVPTGAAAQGYYYPRQAYPPGYYPQQRQQQQRYPQYPGYPQQHPQQQRHPQQQQQQQQQQRQRGYESHSNSTTQDAQPRQQRAHKDISSDTPPTADITALTSAPLVTYTWHDRDTLGDLAKAAGISNSQILALNNLSVSQLRSGQVLRLPPLANTTPSLDIERDPADQTAREIWRGVRGKKRIALTFDAGGVTDGLDVLLQNLTSNDAPATFFATGEFARDYPKALKSIDDAGFRIYNHSWSHPEFTTLTDEEIRTQLARTDDILTSVTGRSTKPFWRPPFGDRDKRVLNVAADAGYTSIYWTHDSLDSVGDKKDAAFVANRILNPPKSKANPDGFLDGAIILMHVGETGSANAVSQIISDLRQRGFTLVTVEQILQP